MSHTISPKTQNTVSADGSTAKPAKTTDDRSVAELVQDLSEQVSRLVRDELALAVAELTKKGKRAGVGAGLFGGAGITALYGVAALLTAVILGLTAAGLPAWLSALIVAVVLFVVAAVMGLSGKKQIEEATPPMPEEAVRSIKADVNTVKERAHR